MRRSSAVRRMTASWEAYYKYVYNLKVDFGKVVVPETRPGFDYLIAVPRRMSMDTVLDVSSCLGHFRNWSSDSSPDCWICDREEGEDRDDFLVSAPFAPRRSYFTWIRGGFEAEEDLKGFSADAVQKAGLQAITTLEYLLFHHKVFLDTGIHCDQTGRTLQAGSRGSTGEVPYSIWEDERLILSECGSNSTADDLRAREAIRLPYERKW